MRQSACFRDAALAMLEVAAIGMLVVEDWTWDELWTGGLKPKKTLRRSKGYMERPL